MPIQFKFLNMAHEEKVWLPLVYPKDMLRFPTSNNVKHGNIKCQTWMLGGIKPKNTINSYTESQIYICNSPNSW